MVNKTKYALLGTRQGKTCLIALFSIFAIGGWINDSSAAILNFSGKLDLITTNAGGARYSSSSIGQVFSGSFTYGLESQATTDPLFPGDYDFASPPFNGFITDGVTPTTGSPSNGIQVSISDNLVLDAETSSTINVLFGSSFSAGDSIDVSDIDTQFDTVSGGSIVFGLSFSSLTDSSYAGTGFANFPPESGNIDRALFFVSEFDAADNLIFEGLGKLDSITTVPVPAAVWLFGSGLLGLIGAARRKRQSK